MEVKIPIESNARRRGLAREIEKAKERIQNTPVSGEEHYKQMGGMGRILWELYLGEGHARVKAFENPSLVRFMHRFFDAAEQRAKELGYRWEDVMISPDSYISRSGVIMIKVIPNPGAKRLA